MLSKQIYYKAQMRRSPVWCLLLDSKPGPERCWYPKLQNARARVTASQKHSSLSESSRIEIIFSKLHKHLTSRPNGSRPQQWSPPSSSKLVAELTKPSALLSTPITHSLTQPVTVTIVSRRQLRRSLNKETNQTGKACRETVPILHPLPAPVWRDGGTVRHLARGMSLER